MGKGAPFTAKKGLFAICLRVALAQLALVAAALIVAGCCNLEYSGPQAAPPTFGDDTCLVLPGFGRGQDGQWTPEDGVRRYGPPTRQRFDDGPWPHNTDNVLPGLLYVSPNGHELCWEYSMPYG
jgi:hypothetical protein